MITRITRIKRVKVLMFTLLSGAILAIIFMMSLLMHYSSLHHVAHENQLKLKLLSSQIVLHDDILTMSAWLAALTGKVEWKQKYESHESLLEQALQQALRQQREISNELKILIEDNKRLIALEKSSFANKALKFSEKKIPFLQNNEYSDLKAHYALMTQRAIKKLEIAEAQENAKYHQKVELLQSLIILFSVIFSITWVGMARYLFISDKYIRALTITDELTGLNNRRAFNDNLTEEINRSGRERRILILAILDVDNFKLYNDHYGHPAGDQVLAKIGNVMKKNSRRATEFTYRIGGEEFAMITSADSREEGVKWVESVIKTVESLAIEHLKNPPINTVTVSAGMAILSPENTKTSNEFYRNADCALYDAKNSGKNTLVEFKTA